MSGKQRRWSGTVWALAYYTSSKKRSKSNKVLLLVDLEAYCEESGAAGKVLIASSTEAALSEIYFSESIYCRWHSGGFLLARAESSERHYCSVYAWDRSQPACFCIQNELEEFFNFSFFFSVAFSPPTFFLTVSWKKQEKNSSHLDPWSRNWFFRLS